MPCEFCGGGNPTQESQMQAMICVPNTTSRRPYKASIIDAYQEGTNIVLLEPDVARAFRDSASVNRALRLLMELARDQAPKNAQQ